MKIYAWAVLRETVDEEYRVFTDENDAYDYAHEFEGDDYEVVPLVAPCNCEIKNKKVEELKVGDKIVFLEKSTKTITRIKKVKTRKPYRLLYTGKSKYGMKYYDGEVVYASFLYNQI